MNYIDFNNICIINERGVCSVSGDTQMLGRYAATLSPQKTLEIGCGTGFVSIFLSTLGFNVFASDISSRSVSLTIKNSDLNGQKISCIQSNLFDEIHDSYSLIIFNPPYGSTKSAKFASFLEFFKSMLPRDSVFVGNITYFFISKARRLLIKEFISQAKNHLIFNGCILLTLHEKEMDLLQELKYEIKDTWRNMKLVSFSFN